jgi:predicted small metal-binding protein
MMGDGPAYDNMYAEQAARASDRIELAKAIKKSLYDHIFRKHNLNWRNDEMMDQIRKHIKKVDFYCDCIIRDVR